MLTTEQTRDGLVIRTARKQWRCEGQAERDATGNPILCRKIISPGECYLEFLGESHAYESGFRYCAEHAHSEWGVEL